MRVAIFTETAPPSVNGIVRRLEQTIRLLREHGDEVLVFAPAGAPRQWQGAEVAPAPSFPLPIYPELSVGMPRPALRARLARFSPDVVHIVNPALLGAGGLLYARRLELPILASFHTHLPRYLHHYGLGALEPLAWDLLRSLHNQATLNIGISNPIAEELRRHGVERVQVGWRGGVDSRLFRPERASRAMRERLSDGHPDAPLLVYAGRLGAEKGLELFPELLPQLPEARLALVGDGPQRPLLEQRLATLPVHFGGYLRGEELASAVASADVFVFPSQTDTLGLVLLEAMAAGTPVVAAAGGGVPEVVRDGLNGLLFQPGDATDCADAVRRMLGDGVSRELVRVAAYRDAQDWTWEAAVADLRALYAQVMEVAIRPAAA